MFAPKIPSKSSLFGTKNIEKKRSWKKQKHNENSSETVRVKSPEARNLTNTGGQISPHTPSIFSPRDWNATPIGSEPLSVNLLG